MNGVIALCVGFCGIVLFTHLLRAGSLGAGSYSTLVITTVLAAVALSKIDALAVLDLKNLSVQLREVQEIKADLYAKTEAVRKLGEELADIAGWNVRITGRFVNAEALDREIIRRRDQIVVLLREIGSSDDRINQITAPMTLAVTNDLRREVEKAFIGSEAARQMNGPERARLQEVIKVALPAAILDALPEAARTPEVRAAVARLEGFLSSDTLD